jgi:hypothetical protein
MATTYRYLFVDLLSNTIIGELPLTSVSFTQQLNQPGSFQGHLLYRASTPINTMYNFQPFLLVAAFM